jgi:cell division protein FtsW
VLTASARSTQTKRTTAKPRPGPSGTATSSFWILVIIVGILCLIGVVMVLSASSIQSLRQYGSPWHFFIRQWIWLAIGGAGFGLALRVDHNHWRRPSRVLMYLALGLLVAVLAPGVGVSANGASRWIGTSSIQLQPAELAKLALILFAADVLDSRADRGDWRYQAAPLLAMLGALIVLVMLQPDMGTTMVLVFIVGAMLFTAAMPLVPLTGLAVFGTLCGYGLAKMAPYRWKRMTAFINPFKDASNTGYQSVQGLLALSHGHVLGDGLGSSLASYGYLPNAQTDFIFAVIGEETGLIGGFFLSALFVTFALVGVRVACRAPSRFAALVSAGITAWLVGQAMINIGAVVGLLPVTGVPLPFVSFGGSSLVIAMFGAGLLANIARQA